MLEKLAKLLLRIVAQSGALKGGFVIFQHPFCRETSKKLKGDLRKKSHNVENNCKGDPLVSSGIVCYAEKTFLVQFSRPNGSIWHYKIL